jgi:hypothetical protein
MFCYVGNWLDAPTDLTINTTAFDLVHPRDFKERRLLLGTVDYPLPIWTNNPLIVDLFDALYVMVCARTDFGRIIRRSLAQNKDCMRLGKEFSTGELWSFLGESWVLDDSALVPINPLPGFTEVAEVC